MKRKTRVCTLLTAGTAVLLAGCQASGPSAGDAPALIFQDTLSSRMNGERVEPSAREVDQWEEPLSGPEFTTLKLQDYQQDSVPYRISAGEGEEDFPDQVTVCEWNVPREGGFDSRQEADRLFVQECGGPSRLVQLRKDRYYEVQSVWLGEDGRQEKSAVYYIATE